MLQELRIKDFAIIDELALTLSHGFLAMTGETGAGKSIIVDAVNLLLGERSDTTMVRSGSDRALVEGIFQVPAHLQDQLQAHLQSEGLEGETPDELLLMREVRVNGRSQCRVNGVQCSLTVYREIGGMLVDIHGQGEHLSLLKPSQHLYLLDRYAGLENARVSLRAVVHQLHGIREEIKSLLTDEAALARRMDMLQYQIQEIQAAALRPEEEEELKQERNRLVNAEKISELATEALFALLGEAGEASAVDLLSQVALALGKLAKLDPAADERYQVAETLSTQAEELSRALRQYRDEIEFDPRRLDEIEDRIEALTQLKRKYGGSIEAVLTFAEKAQMDLDTITHSEERLAELREEEEKLLRHIGEMAGKLSQERQSAAKRLTEAIVKELADLRMQDARFEVQIAHHADPEGCYVDDQRLAFNSSGIDQLEFYMAANIGEPIRPLAKVASGGEVARIMLGLKTVLSYADQIPTLIFDEIDQGLGGRMGSVVGQKLWELSMNHQVLVVTHLAQLAGFADAHYKVSKHVLNKRTVTRAEFLNDQGRVEELADMLGAETNSARQSAYDILMLARRTKEGRRLETA